jgi:parallel beta-helix repeat protein
MGLALVVLALIAGLAGIGWWYQTHQAGPGPSASTLSVEVTSAADRGPGTLREALFIVAGASGRAQVLLKVRTITPASALPPLVNPHGVQIVASEGGTQIDARALGGSPVFDVAGADTSLEGVTLSHCKAAALLLRAAHFRLHSSTIEDCDVGVDVAENASDLLLEHNHFAGNRIAVRFAGSSRNTVLNGNDFAHDRDAGVWAVRAEPDARGSGISVRDNRFDGDRSGVVAANVAMLIEHNEFSAGPEAAVHLLGTGAVVRGNHIGGGPAMGIIAENARETIIERNELDHLAAYGIMVRNSANILLRANRITNCGYGLAFVLGDQRNPSTAVDNTIIEPQFNGIDVIGDSPILRRNQVLRPHAFALHVIDFQPAGGAKVAAHPFLDDNNFRADTAAPPAPDTRSATRRP